MFSRLVRINTGLLSLAPLAAGLLLLLGAPSGANATLALYLQEAGVNGGAITQVATGANFDSTSFTGTYGDFRVSILGGSSDNGASLSDLLSSTTSVKNNSGSTATLHLYVSQNNYTLPAGTPLKVESGLGGSVTTGNLGLTGIFQAYADQNNGLLALGGFTNGPQNATKTGSTFDTGSARGLFSRTGNYSLSSVANITLSGGGQINYSSHVRVTATPEPSTMAMVATLVPLLGFGLRMRRRRATA